MSRKPYDLAQYPKIEYFTMLAIWNLFRAVCVVLTIRILKGLRDYNDHAHDDPLRILEFWRVWKQLRWNGLVLEDPCAHHLLLRRPTVS